MIGDINLNCNIKTFNIVSKYEETELIKENIKLLYDYKKYLFENQVIPITHTYLNKEEVKSLTKKFLKENLEIINKSFETTTKNIKIYEYNDNNRLRVYNNIGECSLKALNEYPNNSLFAFNNLNDSKVLIGNFFTKTNKNMLLSNNNIKIKVEEILKIHQIYDTIVLPYLIKDNYHDELFNEDYQYNIKVMIYVALSKCRHNLIILCPSSKTKELGNLLEKTKIVK